MNNGAIFNPEDKSLVIAVKVKDVKVFYESGGLITIAIANMDDGIDIVHNGERLWWPV